MIPRSLAGEAMSAADIDDLLGGMTNENLVTALQTAKDDLAKVSVEAPNSEWHEACFAGFLTFSAEASKRGIKLHTEH